MTYRNIEVDGKIYQYVIGKHNTKIKHVGVYNNSDIGNEIKVTYSKHVKRFVVTPKTIELLIRGEPTPNSNFCYEHGLTTLSIITSSNLDLHNIHACPKCIEELRCDV